PAFYLGSSEVDTLLRIDTKNRVSDLFLGQPETARSIDVYENIHALGRSAPACALDSPWVNVRRSVAQTEHGLRIEDVRVIKKSLITNAELKSAVFHDFQQRLLKCFDRVAVVYEPIRSRPRAISSVASPGATVKEKW